MSTPFLSDGSPESPERLSGPPVALIDLLDRLLTGGAVLTGDLVLSIADVDLVHINLRAVIRSITADEPAPWTRAPDATAGTSFDDRTTAPRR
ncbi:gas vesicle protein [Streptomyces sp. NRRL F-4428]|uniref:gas vesicle protein n=1 Tax=Streptomyces sp. NRRL F-4428 TaxID=1609137 RepID=UPI0005EC42A9|nr:gas vesicle protein [Streptomyces sp. NRRL F-4428]